MKRLLSQIGIVSVLFLFITACGRATAAVAPTITITSPQDNYHFPGERGVTLQVIANSPNSSMNTIEVNVDSAQVITMPVPVEYKNHYETQIQIPNWIPGDHEIEVFAVSDNNDRSLASSIKVIVTGDSLSTPGLQFPSMRVILQPIPKESGTGFSSGNAAEATAESIESWPLTGEIPAGTVTAKGVLSFDISGIPPNAVIDRADLTLKYDARGQPFVENGTLMIDALYYGTTLPKDIYDLGAFANIYNSEVEPIRDIDVIDAIKFSLGSGYPRFQIRLQFTNIPNTNGQFDAMLININTTEIRIIYR